MGTKIKIGDTFLKISDYFSIDLMISVQKAILIQSPGSKWIVLESLWKTCNFLNADIFSTGKLDLSHQGW